MRNSLEDRIKTLEDEIEKIETVECDYKITLSFFCNMMLLGRISLDDIDSETRSHHIEMYRAAFLFDANSNSAEAYVNDLKLLLSDINETYPNKKTRLIDTLVAYTELSPFRGVDCFELFRKNICEYLLW
ncbi:hypothetical protein AGMMS49975_14240 [Clostridia bacterium]|nr:hypothetical protein AGMMS49975_14240 [Clostridia bacterium]